MLFQYRRMITENNKPRNTMQLKRLTDFFTKNLIGYVG